MYRTEKSKEEKAAKVLEMYKAGAPIKVICETLKTNTAFIYDCVDQMTGERPKAKDEEIIQEWEKACKYIRDRVVWCKNPVPGVKKIKLKPNCVRKMERRINE